MCCDAKYELLCGSSMSDNPEESTKPTRMSRVLLFLIGIICAITGVLYQLEDDDIEIILAEKSVALSKSRIKVFQYISDLRTYSEWYPTSVSFEPSDTAPMSVGKRFTEVHYIPLLGEMAYESVITGYESPRYVSFLTDTLFQLRTEMEVERKDGANQPFAQLTWRLHSKRRSYFFRYLICPCLKVFYSHRARQALFNLRFLMQE